jgi:hypothetical protein
VKKRYPWWVYGLIALLVLVIGFVFRACYESPLAASARTATRSGYGACPFDDSGPERTIIT